MALWEATPEETLETLVDRLGVAAVLTALGQVCHGKADHIRTAWQDAALARSWERAGLAVETVISKLPKVPGITGVR